jgi:hypothetical protein
VVSFTPLPLYHRGNPLDRRLAGPRNASCETAFQIGTGKNGREFYFESSGVLHAGRQLTGPTNFFTFIFLREAFTYMIKGKAILVTGRGGP